MSRVAGHMVVATDQDMEPIGDSDQPCYRDRGRNDDQRAIAAIFVHAAWPCHSEVAPLSGDRYLGPIRPL
jgi:hypothetical protein